MYVGLWELVLLLTIVLIVFDCTRFVDQADVDAATDDFNGATTRMVVAIANLQKVSDDSARNAAIGDKASTMQRTASQLIRVASVKHKNKSSKATDNLLEQAKRDFYADTAALHQIAVNMMDLKQIIRVDFDAVKALASAAITAAVRGYPAAARSTCRKMMQRVKHIMFLTNTQVQNSLDADQNRRLSLSAQSLDAKGELINPAIKSLSTDPRNKIKVKKFTDVVNSVVTCVGELFASFGNDANDSSSGFSRIQVSEKQPNRRASDDEGVAGIPTDAQAPPPPTSSGEQTAGGDSSSTGAPNAGNGPANSATSLVAPPDSADGRNATAMMKRQSSNPALLEQDRKLINAALKLRKDTEQWSQLHNPIVKVRQSHIITPSPPLFKNSAKKSGFEMCLSPSSTARCWVRNTSRIQYKKVQPHFIYKIIGF